VSEPVKTEFGYHLIQLRAQNARQALCTWEEIKDELIAAERDNFLRKALADHVEKLKTLPIEASEESVAAAARTLRHRFQAAPVAKAAVAAPEAATSRGRVNRSRNGVAPRAVRFPDDQGRQ
jgi:hypothetical protein